MSFVQPVHLNPDYLQLIYRFKQWLIALGYCDQTVYILPQSIIAMLYYFESVDLFNPKAISNGSGNKMLNSIQNLMRFLKKGHPKIRNVNHLRASVITYWTKKYNLRKVQYLAGHRYISPSENYELNNINDLKSSIISLHPF